MKAFQIRAARSVTGIGVKEIALYLGVSGTIVSRWDNMSPLKTIKSKATNPDALIFFFKQHKILFPTENSISLDIDSINTTVYLSRFQLRSSRSILGLSQRELAEATQTSKEVINYLEGLDNIKFINNTPKDVDTTLYKVFFEKNGITFPDSYSVNLNPDFF
jgi:DNA-binding transcriptional regulator YiaG